MKRTPWITMLAAALLVGALGCGKEETAAKAAGAGAEAAAVLGASDVAIVERADLVTGVQVSGTLSPANDVKFGAPIADVVEDMLVKEGQRVRKGEVMARFRTTAVRPLAVGAESRYKSAKADYARMQNLLREGAVAERDLEAAEATMREAEAQNASAQKMLEESTLRAPFDGTVANRYVQAGDRLGIGDPVLRVVDTHELEFEATVTTTDVAQVHIGAPVVLEVTGYEHAGIEGRVARVNAAADPATRQVKVYVAVPNASGRLVSGLFASGQVVLKRSRQALAIPSTGLRTDGARTFAWVIADGHAAQRAVTTGLKDEVRDRVEILSGLEAGQQVVTGPVSGLKAGQPVQVAKREG
jgi:RND family efflux transporter MFP subunit